MGCNTSKAIVAEMSPEDMQFLKDATGYTEKEIRDWYRGFCQDCPDGRLTKEKFVQVYKSFFRGGNPERYCAHVFRTFDTDGSGWIDFKEFLMAVGMTSAKDPKDKLKWAFRMYDVNNDGSLEVNEMCKIVVSLVEMQTGRPPSEEGDDDPFIQTIRKKVHEVFKKIDVNDDGRVTLEEFIQICTMDKELASLLCVTP